MTAISSGNAALTILTQSQVAIAGEAKKSAADTILDIVSGRKTAESKTTDAVAAVKARTDVAAAMEAQTPREAGGTVSSEIPQPWISAMSQAAVVTLSYSSPESMSVSAAATSETSSVDPWDAAVTEAISRATITVAMAVAINGKFYLEPEVDLDSRLSEIEMQRQSQIAGGTSEEIANAQADLLKRAAEGRVKHVEMINENRVNGANAMAMIYNGVLQQAGVANTVAIDGNGRASVHAFEITDASGRKLLSLGEDGRLTAFNADGSVKTQMSRQDMALATRDINSYTFTMMRSGVDLNQIDLY